METDIQSDGIDINDDREIQPGDKMVCSISRDRKKMISLLILCLTNFSLFYIEFIKL